MPLERSTPKVFVTANSGDAVVNGSTNTVIKIENNELKTKNSYVNEIYSDTTGLRQCILTGFLAVLTMTAIIVLLLIFATPLAQTASTELFDWPPPSDSVMKKFTKAAITTDHPRCSEIGGSVLKAGGNAVEAAIAALTCLGVTNPQSSGLGGGFLLSMYNRTLGKCVSLDARETAPAAATRDMFLNDSDASRYGFRAMGVPGEIAGYWTMFKKYKSGKVTWKSLLEPARDMADNGVPVDAYMAKTMKVKERHYRLFPSMKLWLNPKTNDTYKEGDLIPRKRLAKTLELLGNSEDPQKLFYQEMGKTMAEEIQKAGGIMTAEDFADYRVREQPGMVSAPFRGDLVMCGGPPPSSFVVTQIIPTVMDRLYSEKKGDIKHDPTVTHHFIEAMKFAYAQRTLLGDAAFVASAAELGKNLTSPEYVDWVSSLVKEKAQPTEYYGGIKQTHPPDHGTSQVSVIDEDGNAVSATTTINRWFGAAVESEAYGVLFNDEMDDFSTPGMVNGFGFAPSETNFIEPGKRPMSSMSPLVVYDQNTKNVHMVIGGSGGSKIISAVAKAITRPLIFGETIKEGIDAPMVHNQFTPDITQTDDYMPDVFQDILEKTYGQKFRNTSGFEGIVQGIDVRTDGIYACGDFRRRTGQVPDGY